VHFVGITIYIKRKSDPVKGLVWDHFTFLFNHIAVFHNKYLGTFLSDMENVATKDIGKPFTNPKIHVYF
jgi:hypothetical protein